MMRPPFPLQRSERIDGRWPGPDNGNG